MKKIFLSLATLFSIISFAQEKEIKEAFNSFESGNKVEAQALIQQVEPIVLEKAQTLDPDIYAKYLYVKGSTLLDQGKSLEASQLLSTLSAYENGPVYSLKNKETKEKVFVISKQEANTLQSQKGFVTIKETKSGTGYMQKLLPAIDQKRQTIANKATEEYNAKNYAKAANDFSEAYYLSKAAGSDDEIYMYYAAISYHASENKAKALELYKKLIESGYTGRKVLYTAIQNGQRVGLTEQQYNLFKSTPNSGFSDFKTEETPSVESEIYSYAVSLLSADKKYDEALSFAQKGLSRLPGDKNLTNQLGELYYQTGQTDKYIAQLKLAVKKDPKDYLSLYNLGVVYSKDPKTYDQAKEYYNKALAVKPDYAVVYLNLASLYLTPDKEIVEQMKALGSTKADQQKYEGLVSQRKEMFKEALPYMEKAYAYDKKDIAIIQAMKEAYRVLGMRDKLEEIRKAEEAM